MSDATRSTIPDGEQADFIALIDRIFAVFWLWLHQPLQSNAQQRAHLPLSLQGKIQRNTLVPVQDRASYQGQELHHKGTPWPATGPAGLLQGLDPRRKERKRGRSFLKAPSWLRNKQRTPSWRDTLPGPKQDRNTSLSMPP
ncbi:Hypothetical predicted protein [Pelobates cultripes]|uniref:Uncharacterized protein n=1 Tax=Pelobates cultripes TaxID=61616 RepID=A0AAD1SFH6_PELCU|nr:Hypothetical predicted protein [Pelobates cultripes]